MITVVDSSTGVKRFVASGIQQIFSGSLSIVSPNPATNFAQTFDGSSSGEIRSPGQIQFPTAPSWKSDVYGAIENTYSLCGYRVTVSLDENALSDAEQYGSILTRKWYTVRFSALIPRSGRNYQYYLDPFLFLNIWSENDLNISRYGSIKYNDDLCKILDEIKATGVVPDLARGYKYMAVTAVAPDSKLLELQSKYDQCIQDLGKCKSESAAKDVTINGLLTKVQTLEAKIKQLELDKLALSTQAEEAKKAQATAEAAAAKALATGSTDVTYWKNQAEKCRTELEALKTSYLNLERERNAYKTDLEGTYDTLSTLELDLKTCQDNLAKASAERDAAKAALAACELKIQGLSTPDQALLAKIKQLEDQLDQAKAQNQYDSVTLKNCQKDLKECLASAGKAGELSAELTKLRTAATQAEERVKALEKALATCKADLEKRPEAKPPASPKTLSAIILGIIGASLATTAIAGYRHRRKAPPTTLKKYPKTIKARGA